MTDLNQAADNEIFEPYDCLIEVEICGNLVSVPENNTILRCLQYLDLEKISDAELCWNGECLDCMVWIRSGDKEKAVIACRTKAEAGMKIVRMSPAIA